MEWTKEWFLSRNKKYWENFRTDADTFRKTCMKFWLKLNTNGLKFAKRENRISWKTARQFQNVIDLSCLSELWQYEQPVIVAHLSIPELLSPLQPICVAVHRSSVLHSIPQSRQSPHTTSLWSALVCQQSAASLSSLLLLLFWITEPSAEPLEAG